LCSTKNFNQQQQQISKTASAEESEVARNEKQNEGPTKKLNRPTVTRKMKQMTISQIARNFFELSNGIRRAETFIRILTGDTPSLEKLDVDELLRMEENHRETVDKIQKLKVRHDVEKKRRLQKPTSNTTHHENQRNPQYYKEEDRERKRGQSSGAGGSGSGSGSGGSANSNPDGCIVS